MMTFPTAYHADSDADDEYERSVLTSPILPNDSESSPTDSEPPSAEHTPTTFGGHADVDKSSPRSIVTEWTADECASFVSSLGLSQYCDKFLGKCSWLSLGLISECLADISYVCQRTKLSERH